MNQNIINKLHKLFENGIRITDQGVEISDKQLVRDKIDDLSALAVFGSAEEKALSRYLIHTLGLALGVIPSSIHDLYIARSKGLIPNTFTVPAINLRILSYVAAKSIFRAALKINASAILFEIARSEISYTEQRPSEYSSQIIAAAIATGFTGPVFLQGDHFQFSLASYKDSAENELNNIKAITKEAIDAGFYNIDIDASTLVDLDKATIPEQQERNTTLTAELTSYIRSLEPDGITVSVGGEIGEVGGHNSTEEELRAFADGYDAALNLTAPENIGLSKISIQTGTSHGGVVLPDGSIASVKVDFDTLKVLGRIAREDYGMGGAVQHGASTLPQEAFGEFVKAEAIEVHLATNFQNIFYDHLPEDLHKKVYTYLENHHPNERKEGMSDDQFYYKARKRAFGPFKKEFFNLPQNILDEVSKAWEKQFDHLFASLHIQNTAEIVKQYVNPVPVHPNLEDFLRVTVSDRVQDDASDLDD